MKIKTLFIIQILSLVFCNAQRISKSDSTLFNKYSSVFFAENKIDYPSFDGFGDNHFPEYKKVCSNLNEAITIGVNLVWPSGLLGYNLSGNGISKLGIWDSGAIRGTHKEFKNRIFQIDSATLLSPHSNGVAGVMVASGILPSAKGMSYMANLKAWDFTNDRNEMATNANSLLVSNHSYENLAGWYNTGGVQYWLGDTTLNEDHDWKFGFYDSRTGTWDSISYSSPYYLIVKAVGNDRGASVGHGTPHYFWNGFAWEYSTRTRSNVGPYDCIVTYGTAKNILTVGAVDLLPNGYVSPPLNMLSVSSWGPTDDGRIKPDLVTGTNSTSSTNSINDSSYQSIGGTSVASGAASGALFLLQQHYHNLKGVYLKSATLKGLAIHTANACKTALGPNYESGWGLLNIAKAAKVLSDSNVNIVKEYNLNNNDTLNTMVYINGIDTSRFTICWTDPPAVVTAPAYNDTTPKLVNDIDLRILSLSNNTIYEPYILNPSSPNLAATNGDNIRDNVEQVYGLGIPQGFYKIRVTHKRTLHNNLPQSVSLIGSNIEFKPSNISLSNTTAPIQNIYKGKNNAVLYRMNISVSNSATELTSLKFTSLGSYDSMDISNFKIWYHNDSDFMVGNPVLLSNILTNLGTGLHSINNLSKILNTGLNYIYITSDIPCSSLASSISVNAMSINDLGFIWGTVSGNNFSPSVVNVVTTHVSAFAMPSLSICQGGSIILNGANAISYVWSNGVTNGVSFTPQQTGNYTVTGTDEYGCMYDTTIAVVVNTLPSVVAQASPSSYVCKGALLTLNGSGANNYIWNGGVLNGVPFVPSSSPSTFRVIGVDTITGCQNADSIVVYINSSVIASTSSSSICLGDSVILSASGGVSYAWSPLVALNSLTGSNIVASPTTTTTYTVFGTDSSACVTSDSVTINVFNSAPSVPSNFTVFNKASTSFDINWNSSSNTVNYVLDVASDPVFLNMVTGYSGVAIASAFYSVTGLQSGATYYARIKSVNSCFSSNYLVDTIELSPNAPSTIFSSNITLTSFEANWNSSNGATNYLLDVALDKDFTTMVLGYNSLPVTTTSHLVNGLSQFTKYYYRISAANNSGISSYSTIDSVKTLSVDIHLYLSVFLEGLYTGNNSMTASPFSADGVSPTNIADTIIVELHEDVSPYNTIYSATGLLETNGFADVVFSGTGANNNYYYIVVTHRNSIATWSANPIMMSNAGVSYDFTSSQSQSFGSNTKDDGNGLFLLFGGDINHDGSIDFNDYPDLDIASSNGELGYLPADLNGDASVDFNDYPIIDLNSSLGILQVTP